MIRRRSQIGILVLVILALVMSAFFMANVEMPWWSHIVSSISVVLFAVPCIWAAKMWLGTRDAVILLTVLGFFALLVETSAIITGFPYGHFGYSEHLGYKLFAGVPWTVAFAWPPLLFAAYAVAARVTRSPLLRISFTTLALVVFDLVLDPGAVRLGFWSYANAGSFYGIPISNFAGWVVSGLVGAIILEMMVARLRPLLPVPIQLTLSTFFIICFWTALAAFAGMKAPALIGLAVLVGLVVAWTKFHYHFDDRIVLVDEHDNALGTASKLESHNSDTKLHRAFSVFILNRRGELLLQQRAFSKKTWPGVWSNSCCGHVMLHESVVGAAGRRLKFELGLRGIELTIALPDFRYRAEKDGIVENEICPVLVGLCDSDPFPEPSEVANYRWIEWSEFVTSLDDPECGISPWAVQETRLLNANETFRTWCAERIHRPGSV